MESTLKTNLGYEQLVTALPGQRDLTDQVFQVLVDLYSGIKPFAESVKLNGTFITARELRVRFSRLTEEMLYKMIKRLRGKEIINPSTYLISCLYNAVPGQQEYHVVNERAGQPFLNFEQRNLSRTIQMLEAIGMGNGVRCADAS